MALSKNSRSYCRNIVENIESLYEGYQEKVRDLNAQKKELDRLNQILFESEMNNNKEKIRETKIYINTIMNAISLLEGQVDILRTEIQNLAREYDNDECYLFFRKPDTGYL